MKKNYDFELTKYFIKQYPQTAGSLLALQPASDAANLLQNIAFDDALAVISYLLPSHVARLFEYMPTDLFTQLLEKLKPAATAAILRQFNSKQRTLLLSKLSLVVQADCRLLLDYSLNVVGAWMSSRVTLLLESYSVKDALTIIKKSEDESLFDPIFVVSQERQILGYVRVFSLLKESDDVPVSAVMTHSSLSLRGRLSLEHASESELWQSHYILPVTNRKNEVVGVLRHIDLLHALDKPTNTSGHRYEPKVVTQTVDAYCQLLTTFSKGIANIKLDATLPTKR